MPTSARTHQPPISVGRGSHTPPHGRRAASVVICLRRSTFCQQRQKVPKERRQNQGFEILSAAEVPTARFSIHHANRSAQNSCLAFASSLRLIPRRAPRSCWPDGTGLPSASTVRPPCRALRPAPGAGQDRFGPSGTPAPTDCLPIERRRAGHPPPVAIRFFPHTNQGPGAFPLRGRSLFL